MTGRELEIPAEITARETSKLELHTAPNWTAIIFLLCLSFLHLSIAIPAFWNYRWEGYMSATLSVGFFTAAIIIYRAKCQIVFDCARRSIRIRHGVGRFHFQRVIGFDEVHAVRVTFSENDRPRSRIEVLCDNEDIECPATAAPRQEALCLAMMLNVQLIKVWADSPGFDGEHTARV